MAWHGGRQLPRFSASLRLADAVRGARGRVGQPPLAAAQHLSTLGPQPRTHRQAGAPPVTPEEFASELSGMPPSLPGVPLVLAVSGGVDSMALAFLAARHFHPSSLLAVVVDHGVRAESSDEARKVAELLAHLGVQARVAKIDWTSAAPANVAHFHFHFHNSADLTDPAHANPPPDPPTADPNPPTAGASDVPPLPLVSASAPAASLSPPSSSNIQRLARERRYNILRQVCKEVGASTILTAHHADDQVETLLLRLNHQSGVLGLAGMRALQPIQSYSRDAPLCVYRPLLAFSKERLRATCLSNGVSWFEDYTNALPKYQRNVIRIALQDRLYNRGYGGYGGVGGAAAAVQGGAQRQTAGFSPKENAASSPPSASATDMRERLVGLARFLFDTRDVLEGAIARGLKACVHFDVRLGTATLDRKVFAEDVPEHLQEHCITQLMRTVSGHDYPPRSRSCRALLDFLLPERSKVDSKGKKRGQESRTSTARSNNTISNNGTEDTLASPALSSHRGGACPSSSSPSSSSPSSSSPSPASTMFMASGLSAPLQKQSHSFSSFTSPSPFVNVSEHVRLNCKTEVLGRLTHGSCLVELQERIAIFSRQPPASKHRSRSNVPLPEGGGARWRKRGGEGKTGVEDSDEGVLWDGRFWLQRARHLEPPSLRGKALPPIGLHVRFLTKEDVARIHTRPELRERITLPKAPVEILTSLPVIADARGELYSIPHAGFTQGHVIECHWCPKHTLEGLFAGASDVRVRTGGGREGEDDDG